MPEAFIPFIDEMASAALSGRKTMTSRTRRYGRPGDTFRIEGRRFRLISVRKECLVAVAYLYYEAEGFDSPQAFIDCWNMLHPRRRYRHDQMVWVHRFRMLPEEDPETIAEEVSERGPFWPGQEHPYEGPLFEEVLHE
ncbi:MAG: hypothetical protein HPY73_05785 [Methanomassiliicoccales archaeon]|nr:MAG: hypothetical protein HPY73_05785 [Methanomassiliicoccales archaeon]